MDKEKIISAIRELNNFSHPGGNSHEPVSVGEYRRLLEAIHKCTARLLRALQDD